MRIDEELNELYIGMIILMLIIPFAGDYLHYFDFFVRRLTEASAFVYNASRLSSLSIIHQP